MATFLETSYCLVGQEAGTQQYTLQELKLGLEKGTDEVKIETMRRILTQMLQGDPLPNLLMHIIRFVMPSKSKPLKKLLYLYYELCPKHDQNGKLRQEFILVSNSMCSSMDP
jgi:coatomer subunit beta